MADKDLAQDETTGPYAHYLAAIFAFPIATALIFGAVGNAAWRSKLGDPDNYMRLAQVRDWMSGQGWWRTTQYRVNPPTGLDTHWTRIADVPIAALIEIIDVFTTRDVAERVALTILPLTYLLLALICISFIGKYLGRTSAAFASALLTIVSVYTLSQFWPGRIDHHGLQILLALAVLATIVAGNRFRDGFQAATLTALSLAVGFEAVPYLAVMGAWLVTRWVIRGDSTRAPVIGYSIGMPVCALAALAMIRSPARILEIQHDTLSIAQVSVIVSASMFLALLIKWRSNQTIQDRLVTVGVTGLVALAPSIYFMAAFASPYSNVDESLQPLWLDNIAEMQSFSDSWQSGAITAIGGLFFLILAVLAAGIFALRSRGRDRDRHVLLGMVAFASLALGMWQIRTWPIAYSLCVPIAGLAIAEAFRSWHKGGSLAPFLGLVLIFNPILPYVASKWLQGFLGDSVIANTMPSQGSGQRTVDRQCDEPSHYRALASLRPGLVISPIDISARILVRTHHSVVSASNHRNAEPNEATYLFFISTPETAHSIANRLHARYVVICSTAGETMNLVRHAPRGLLATLTQGQTPDWLREIQPGPTAQLRVFAFTR